MDKKGHFISEKKPVMVIHVELFSIETNTKNNQF